MILNSRLHRERNILWKTWAEPTEQNRPQQKAGANNSIILGHFQKCLTKKILTIDYFLFVYYNLFIKLWKNWGEYQGEIEEIDRRTVT